MKISLSQIKPKLSRDNIKKHIDNIDRAIDQGSNLVIFPELSLNGYNLMDLVFEDAYTIDELGIFVEKSKDIDILLGVALREKERIYNSSVYFSSKEISNIHHKNILPNYGMFEEARFFFEGDSIEPFETKYGRAVSVICEDLWSSSVINKIASLRVDIIYVISASPARGFRDEKLEIERKWESILSTTALLNGVYVVFVNRVGFEDGMGFWGGSMVVNPNGEVEKRAKLFEEDFLEVSLSRQLSKTQKYLLRR